MHRNKLYITLKIPLTYFHNAFRIYTLRTFPLRLPKSNDHLVQIEDLPYAIAVEISHEHYYIFSQTQVQVSQYLHTYSDEQHVFYKTNENHASWLSSWITPMTLMYCAYTTS